MTYATTFSGIGGWELGLNACGWTLKWQCECEPFCRSLLSERFGVPIYDDIRTLVDEHPARVGALIGSPPCQPFSVAGAQRGTCDERHLYPSFLRAVGVLAPRWVLMEQVPAILSLDGGRAFGQYIGGLAALGYDLVWHCIPACAVGAPHRRDRLWIIAHSGSIGCDLRSNFERDNRDILSPKRQSQEAEQEGNGWQSGLGEAGQVVANPLLNQNIGNDKGRFFSESSRGCENVSNAKCDRQSRSRAFRDALDSAPSFKGQAIKFGNGGIRQIWRTEPSMGRVANGIPARVDRLKGLGNAVIPQIPYIIGRAINQIEGEITYADS